MSLHPTVTIIMATYNRAHFIEESLLSILNQAFTNWECLIIDDGGTDNTSEIIALFSEHDSRFQFLKRPDSYKKGLPGCRNYGLDLAQGDYVIFFDDDDFVHPDNLKICLKELDDSLKDFCHYQKLSYSDVKPKFKNAIVKERKSIDKTAIEKVITQEIGLASCTVLWRKHCFNQVRFNENLLYAEEWECYSKLITHNFNGVIIDTVLYYNRKHADSNTAAFYSCNPIRIDSTVQAILLVLQNLKEKKLLTYSLKKYFILNSVKYKEYNLFDQILKELELSLFEKIQWQFFYKLIPLRLCLFGMWNRFKKDRIKK
ncbi:glycosyltransferase family 2 protein [Flavobacterium sp. XS2P12]|uniref:glycosyltransferase family 2 protein n=1 Tax=Flavobacterium melibiosi TaxID=3398734 RepID=UPI003A8665B1